jgi:choline dehydrogenase
VPSNALDGRRVSAADAFLDRPGPNLTVWTDCVVHRVLIAGGRAAGVDVHRDGVAHRLAADRVVLAAGAIGTPTLLLRSGIGAAGALRAAGTPVAADLPGVGANLRDHPVVAVWTIPQDQACRDGGVWHQVMAHRGGPSGEPEVALFLANNVAAEDIPMIGPVLRGRPAASFASMLLRPRSTGTVTLTGPNVAPTVALRLASEPADVDGLALGVRLAWDLIRTAPVAGLVRRPLVWTDRMVTDDRLLRDCVRRFVTPMLHPAGTARMGPDHDGGAVVDQHGQVRGVDRLWVADASVMPTMPSAPTNLTVMMIADRIARWVR